MVCIIPKICCGYAVDRLLREVAVLISSNKSLLIGRSLSELLRGDLRNWCRHKWMC